MSRRGNRRVLVRTGSRDGRTARGIAYVGRYPFEAGALVDLNQFSTFVNRFEVRAINVAVIRICRYVNKFPIAIDSNPARTTLENMPMPQWVLSFPHCHKVFSHSKINPRSATTLFDPLWPTKPDFPDGGLNLACPNCQTPAIYQRFELMYRPD
jgi:hypothetical protein